MKIFAKFGTFLYQSTSVLLARNSQRLLHIFISMFIVIGGICSRSTYTSVSLILKHLRFIQKTQGNKGLVLYTKSITVLVQQSLAGYRVDDLSLLGPRIKRTRVGLPRIIPSLWRRRIREGHLIYAKMFLTISNIYRVVSFTSELNTSSITDPFSGSWPRTRALSYYLLPFVRAFKFANIFKGTYFYKFKPFPILKASPFTWSSQKSDDLSQITSTGVGALYRSAQAIFQSPLSHSIRFFLVYMSWSESWFTRLKEIQYDSPPSYKALGKLGTKVEAAGKIRVFAMVDPVTQWVLDPLHKGLFRVLGRIPMDGTFNQLKPLEKANNWPSLYSYDLKSATDRIPVDLQKAILHYVIGELASIHWKSLLVDRDYRLLGTSFRYSVGQPMGALSSWAMLAIVHHFIVQVAAHRAGLVRRGVLFRHYALLGDDIVIGNTAVAREYLIIMKDIGVTIGLAKSIVSPKGLGLEFAKRTLIRGNEGKLIDISPLSLKEFGESLTHPVAWIQLTRKYFTTFPQSIKALGYGYKVLGGLDRPFKLLNASVKTLKLLFFFPHSYDEIKTWVSWKNKHISDFALYSRLKILIRDLRYDVMNVMSYPHLPEFYSPILSEFFRARVWQKGLPIQIKLENLYAQLKSPIGPYEIPLETLFQEYWKVAKEVASLKIFCETSINSAGRKSKAITFWNMWSSIQKGDSQSGWKESALLLPGLHLLRMLPWRAMVRPLARKSFLWRWTKRLPWIFPLAVFSRVLSLSSGAGVIVIIALLFAGLEELVGNLYNQLILVLPILPSLTFPSLPPLIGEPFFMVLSLTKVLIGGTFSVLSWLGIKISTRYDTWEVLFSSNYHSLMVEYPNNRAIYAMALIDQAPLIKEWILEDLEGIKNVVTSSMESGVSPGKVIFTGSLILTSLFIWYMGIPSDPHQWIGIAT